MFAAYLLLPDVALSDYIRYGAPDPGEVPNEQIAQHFCVPYQVARMRVCQWAVAQCV